MIAVWAGRLALRAASHAAFALAIAAMLTIVLAVVLVHGASVAKLFFLGEQDR